MSKRSIILMEMSVSGIANGVTRCIEVIVSEVARLSLYHIVWFRLIQGQTEEVSFRYHEGYKIISMGFSRFSRVLGGSQSEQKTFLSKVYNQIKPELGDNPILHLHTLNLIGLALYIKQMQGAKIITHLHCIPWKGLYNRDLKLFNHLYNEYEVCPNKGQSSLCISRHEYECFTKSDCVICVTECGKKHVEHSCPKHMGRLLVIPNGLMDITPDSLIVKKEVHNPVKLLFVGNPNPSKGLEDILNVLEIVMFHADVTLTVAGNFTPAKQKEIHHRHPFIDIRFVGHIPLYMLRAYYEESDIGLIASLQEQCSYAAIEMMMFGLPIVTTDIDGLHELFTEDCALKIPVAFNKQTGLRSDEIKMAEAILRIIADNSLRFRLSANVRRRYLHHYTASNMIKSIKEIYLTI